MKCINEFNLANYLNSFGGKMKKLLTALLFSAILISGCGKEADSNGLSAPFTDVTWETTPEELKEEFGLDYEGYDSIYGGITYSYKTDYDNYSGVVKYMYDGNDELKCVALALSFSEDGEQSEAYEKLHSEIVSKYGEGGFNTENYTSKGDVWYRESGDILISAMTTNTQKAVQYSYLHPSVSHQK